MAGADVNLLNGVAEVLAEEAELVDQLKVEDKKYIMKGRKLGQCQVSIDDMTKIIKLTEAGKSRPEIAEEVGYSKKTIYNWQKKLLS